MLFRSSLSLLVFILSNNKIIKIVIQGEILFLKKVEVAALDGKGEKSSTFKGKYIGNQLIIPLLFVSIVTGFVDSSILLYSTVSK